MGRLDEAREVIGRLRALTPVVLPDRCLSAIPSTASCSCRACAWRWARGMTATRRLAAILAADVAGYSRLMGADEEGTLVG